jgi:hypothetical protein
MKKHEKRVHRLVEKWVKITGLGWWQRLECNYYDKQDEFVKDNNRVCIMRTHIDWSRLWAEIDVNLPMVKQLDDKELEYVVLHELCHIMVSPMHSNKRIEIEELVVTRLAQAFLWVRGS